jgi:hypothetical protein
MSLILLAIFLSVVACIVAYHLAIYALPFMVGLTAFKYVYATDAGFLMSGLAAIGAALLSIAVVIAVLGFAKNPFLRLGALAVFTIPAAIAGYALVYGVTKNAAAWVACSSASRPCSISMLWEPPSSHAEPDRRCVAASRRSP